MGNDLVLYLLVPLTRWIKVFNLFNYITFRAAGAFVTSLLVAFIVGPAILRRLRAMAVHQVVREGTPDTHRQKGDTPTMGGLIILAATIVPTVLWARLNNRYVVLALAVMVWMGAIGFLDDYLKLQQKRRGEKNRGLVERCRAMSGVDVEPELDQERDRRSAALLGRADQLVRVPFHRPCAQAGIRRQQTVHGVALAGHRLHHEHVDRIGLPAGAGLDEQ